MTINSSARNASKIINSAWHHLVDENQKKIIVKKAILAHVAASLMYLAVVLTILAIFIVMNGANVGQVLSWDGPMPWGIILAITGLLVLYASSLLPQTN